MDILPREDLTSLIFWPKHILTEIDSQLLIRQYKDTSGYYLYLHKLLTSNPESPYKLNNAELPVEQFMWAFSIVSSRQLALNNWEIREDPKMQLLIMPLLDFMNHANLPKDEKSSEGPNVSALPYHDTVNNESFVVVKALRDIKKDE
jgi:hypothetical protein